MASNLESKKKKHNGHGEKTQYTSCDEIQTHLRTGCRQTLDAAPLEMPAETDTTVTGNLKCEEPWAYSKLTRPANKGGHEQRPTLRHAMGAQTHHPINQSAHNWNVCCVGGGIGMRGDA
jgi:hypothetical protein